MVKKGRAPKATRRERWSWYMYDFGNSAYAAVVLLAVYSAYFKGEVVGGAEGSRLWGIAVGIAMLVVAITAPFLGAIADFSGTKKRILFIYTTMAVSFTSLLFFVQKGDIFLGMLLFILAEIGYRSAQVFYNALLPEIAHLDEMGHISGNGWAIGSLGGIVCLLLVLPLIVLIGGTFVVRLSLVITAVFFAASTIPLFLFLREQSEPRKLPKGENVFSMAVKQLGATIKEVRNYKDFLRFILAFLIYNDGILMTLNFASIIGAVLFGMTQQQLIIFMIIVQITSVAGAYLFGILSERIGSKNSLVISLILMTFTVSLLFLVQSLTVFYVIGALAGLALTGVQSVSRTMVGQLSPPGQSAQFYGFFAVAGRTSSFIGPTIYGILAAETAKWYQAKGQTIVIAEQMGIRTSVISIIAFLVIGTILLLYVKKDRRDEGLEELQPGV